MKRKYIKIIFYSYIFFLLVFVVFKFKGSFYEMYDKVQSVQWNRELGNWNYNLILFKSIKDEITHLNDFWAIKNLIGNIIVFIPLGFLIPLIFPKVYKFYKVFLICLISILTIEIIQFITMLGSFDVDDILLNLLGCIIGYGCFKIYNASIYGGC